MFRNVESHFSQLPSVSIQRSMFQRPSTHVTTFNAGDLIPIYVDEILPGDTVQARTSKVVRLQTLLAPIFDNAYLDLYWYFVPNRLVWDHWQEFCGENTESAWAPTTTYTIPKISSPSGGWHTGTIADYMGIPVGVETVPDGEEPNLNYDHFPTSLPFRAYALICNEFFRDENLTDPLLIPTGDAMQTGSNGDSYISDVANGGMPFKVSRYHDYFSSCLPAPQKGDSVSVPLAGFPGGTFAVTPRALDEENLSKYVPPSGNPPIQWDTYKHDAEGAQTYKESLYMRLYSGSLATDDKWLESTNNHFLYPANLFTDIPSTEGSAIDIRSLRLAFAAQRMLEKNARSGTRYIEILRSHFGVTSPDARLQRPEYLGGNRIPLSVRQVTNNAQTATDFLGDLGAMSYTSDVHSDFTKSFVEHGYLMCVACVRYDHTYAQGLEKMWTRNIFEDFYLPVFANLGEMPVLKSEIYYDGHKPQVFGYQEAWAEYRYKPNRVSGEMRPHPYDGTLTPPGSLAYWHLADDYEEAPTLSDSWVRETPVNLDRVLTVSHSVANQVLLDTYFDMTYTRPMPMYSIPGLLDHN